jgi:hypothetical protein
MSPRNRHASKKVAPAETPANTTLAVSLKAEKAHCGLCGKARNLTKTECCGNWICDDQHKYQLFTFARNSCSRNHDRYTLCGHHYSEDHTGDWKTCQKCREDFEPEMHVYFGTNEYNFEKLSNPPKFEPTHCSKCKRIISLSQDGYMLEPGGKYVCMECSDLPEHLR